MILEVKHVFEPTLSFHEALVRTNSTLPLPVDLQQNFSNQLIAMGSDWLPPGVYQVLFIARMPEVKASFFLRNPAPFSSCALVDICIFKYLNI